MMAVSKFSLRDILFPARVSHLRKSLITTAPLNKSFTTSSFIPQAARVDDREAHIEPLVVGDIVSGPRGPQ